MRFYCPEPLASSPIHPLFLFRFAPEEKIGGLFKDNLPDNFFETKAEYAEDIEHADAIILPNNFTRLDDASRQYIAEYAKKGEEHKKSVFAFSCGDHTDTLVFDPRVHVFKYSLYRSTAQPNEISAPTLTEDIGKEGITLRQKKDRPTVSFCGKGSFSSPREKFAGWLKRIFIELGAIVNPPLRARIRGVFWRIWSINICKKSDLIETKFIIRKSFSGAQQTIELDPVQARKDFIANMRDADFVLAPKGDGNYSNRFLEALAMGRIPVVVDTDMVLPFEDKINYKKIIVRVPMNRLHKIPEYVQSFYDDLSTEEWGNRQQYARGMFEQYLRQDSFWKESFSQARSLQTQK